MYNEIDGYNKNKLIIITLYYFIFININISLFTYFDKDYECELYINNNKFINTIHKFWILVNFINNIIMLLIILGLGYFHMYNNLSYVIYYISIFYRYIYIILTIIGMDILSRFINIDKCDNDLILFMNIQIPINILTIFFIFILDFI